MRNRAKRGPDMHQGIKIEFEWARFADYVEKTQPPIQASAKPYPELELAKAEPTIAGYIAAHREFAKKYGRLALLLATIPSTPSPLAGLIKPAGPSLVATGQPLITKPLDQFPDLYLELAKAEPTLTGHREFAKKYGLLTNREEEPTSVWSNLVRSMRDLIALVEDKANWKIRNGKYVPYEHPGSFTFRFGPNGGETDEMTLSIVPNNLYNALVMQCVSNHASGAKVRACKACGALFEIGGASGRRSHRAFCSDKCRFDFSHRNRKGKQ